MLINSVVYQGGKKVAEVQVDEIKDWLSKPDCFVWVALKDATAEEMEVMKETFNLHELAVEDAIKGQQRPKVEEYGQTVFVAMHLLKFDGEAINVGEVDVFVGKQFVLSVRNRSNQGFLGVRDRCESEPELLSRGSGFVLYALIDAVVDRYFPVVDAIETELDEIEDKIFEHGAARHNIQRLYTLKRHATVLRHAVAPLLEVATKLHGGRVPAVCMSSQEYFRDVHDHLARINGTIDTIRETIGTAIQVNLSMVTIEESETTKRLAAWAAMFAVPTALAGIWGMNFEVMPELKWKYGYLAALAVIGGVSGLLYRRFKRLGWL